MARRDVGLRAILAPEVEEREVEKEVSTIEKAFDNITFSPDIDVPNAEDLIPDASQIRSGVGRATGQGVGRVLPGKAGSAVGGVLGEVLAGERGSGDGEGGGSGGFGEKSVSVLQDQLEVQEQILSLMQEKRQFSGDPVSGQGGGMKEMLMGGGLLGGGGLGALAALVKGSTIPPAIGPMLAPGIDKISKMVGGGGIEDMLPDFSKDGGGGGSLMEPMLTGLLGVDTGEMADLFVPDDWGFPDPTDLKPENWGLPDASDLKPENWGLPDSSDLVPDDWEIPETPEWVTDLTGWDPSGEPDWVEDLLDWDPSGEPDWVEDLLDWDPSGVVQWVEDLTGWDFPEMPGWVDRLLNFQLPVPDWLSALPGVDDEQVDEWQESAQESRDRESGDGTDPGIDTTIPEDRFAGPGDSGGTHPDDRPMYTDQPNKRVHQQYYADEGDSGGHSGDNRPVTGQTREGGSGNNRAQEQRDQGVTVNANFDMTIEAKDRRQIHREVDRKIDQALDSLESGSGQGAAYRL